MRPDAEIEADVTKELAARSGNDTERVAAQVHHGVVNLSGSVRSYCEKYRIEQATLGIADVAGVINTIEVCPGSSVHLSDEEIRCAALHALQTELPTEFTHLRVRVFNGEVTLEGHTSCHFLRERAENAVRRVGTIPVIHNAIALEPAALARSVRERIDEKLQNGFRSAIGDLSVESCDGTVTLQGHVTSAAQRELAEQAAWSVSGVTGVKNVLVVQRLG